MIFNRSSSNAAPVLRMDEDLFSEWIFANLQEQGINHIFHYKT